MLNNIAKKLLTKNLFIVGEQIEAIPSAIVLASLDKSSSATIFCLMHFEILDNDFLTFGISIIFSFLTVQVKLL